jgi:hypothetical protein
MVANFSDFGLKICVFIKNQRYDPILPNFAVFRLKNANFFGENISKIITSVPDEANF